jgi:hypothetical protein
LYRLTFWKKAIAAEALFTGAKVSDLSTTD